MQNPMRLPTRDDLYLLTTEAIAVFCASTFTSGFWLGWLTGKRGAGGGTVSSLVTLLLQIFLLWIGVNWVIMSLLTVGSFYVGLWVIAPAEAAILSWSGPRRRHTGEIVEHDFNETTIDEFHGQLLAGMPIWLIPAFVTLPVYGDQIPGMFLVYAFVIFRVFDGVKPGPVSWAEKRWHGTSFGVMIDDTVAGALSGLLITIGIVMSAFISPLFF